MNLKHKLKSNIVFTDEILGRLIYGNTNTFSKNTKGILDVSVNRIMSPRKSTNRFERIEKNYREHGCSYITEYINKELISDIAKQHNLLIEDPEVYDLRDDHILKSGHARRTIYDAHLHIQNLKNLIKGDIKEIVEECYKSYFDIMRVVTHRNYYVDDTISERGVYSNKWHCDARRPSVFKIMLNLSDVTSDDGPFHILNKSRTREMLQRGFRDRHHYGRSSECIDDIEKMDRLIGPQGTAMICNTNECLHKAGKIQKGHYRDMLMIQLVPSSKEISDDWIKRKNFDVR